MTSNANAIRFLHDLERGDLAVLLEHARFEVVDENPADWFSTAQIHFHAPAPYDDALRGLGAHDKGRIVTALKKCDADLAEISGSFKVHLDAAVVLEPDQQLLGDLIAEKNMLIDVATGGARINDVDDYYKARRKRISRELRSARHDDPNQFGSLWEWYKQWPGTYRERRGLVGAMYAPLLEKLCQRTVSPTPPREPTGWDRVDRTLDKARGRLNTAAQEEDFQAIGLLCREVLISVAQAVFDSSRHSTHDGVKASETDGKRMLEAYFAAELQGGDLEATRKHARASLDLAVTLQHKRTADFRFAALCVEATSSVVNIVAIVSGRRDA